MTDPADATDAELEALIAFSWPRIFRSVELERDRYDEPDPDRFGFWLACRCVGTAERDENLAYWVPRITMQCREHHRAARKLPTVSRRRQCKPGETVVRFDLGLARVEFLPWDASWRIGFRCSCILNASVDPLTGYLRPDARWSCYEHTGPS